MFKRLKHKVDPRSYAGAIFLGLNGFAVKTHGNSDALSFANAIKYAVSLTEVEFNKQISKNIKKVADLKLQLKKTDNI